MKCNVNVQALPSPAFQVMASFHDQVHPDHAHDLKQKNIIDRDDADGLLYMFILLFSNRSVVEETFSSLKLVFPPTLKFLTKEGFIFWWIKILVFQVQYKTFSLASVPSFILAFQPKKKQYYYIDWRAENNEHYFKRSHLLNYFRDCRNSCSYLVEFGASRAPLQNLEKEVKALTHLNLFFAFVDVKRTLQRAKECCS